MIDDLEKDPMMGLWLWIDLADFQKRSPLW